MEERVLVISRNGIVTVVGPMPVKEAKEGQLAIIKKMKPGTGNVVIQQTMKLEDFMKQL